MGKLRAAWLFLLGVLIIGYGFYELYKRGFPYAEPTEDYSRLFMVMFLGLAVAGIGSAYGRRRIKKDYEMHDQVRPTDIPKPPAAPPAPPEPPKAAQEKQPPAKAESAAGGLVCLQCGEENKPRAKFCEECGSKLMKACAACGEENKPTAKFCEECGQKL
jgi:ribosomal protein L40E